MLTPQFLSQVHRRLLLPCLVLACFVLIGAAASPSTAPAGIELIGLDGKSYAPIRVAGHKAAVLVFVLHDCPICNAYAPAIERMAKEFSDKDVSFYLVHVDPTLTDADARKHAQAYGYQVPVLIDRHHDMVTALAIETAPTAVVLGPDGACQYKGRIDDRFAGIGKPRTVNTTHELQDALSAVVEGKPVEIQRTPTIGCAVPELPAK